MADADRSADLGRRLDRLADAFASHGVDVRSNLLPGASAADLDDVEASLSVRLPPSYRDLYTWSAGCADPDRGPELKFRDNTFLRLDRVVECRRSLVETYGDLDGVDLATVAPFAEFMGSVYFVECAGVGTGSPDPTVYGAFHGLDPYFLSIEAMVETCIAWVEQPDYEPHRTPPDEVEIWRRHNPGIAL